ncbi:MAG: hypothetical protein GX295_09505 [Syntrophomonadaceae bacterium]|nr:hypothetical protein [Syntrophomonadaceae bacterium]
MGVTACCSDVNSTTARCIAVAEGKIPFYFFFFEDTCGMVLNFYSGAAAATCQCPSEDD